MHWSKKCTGFEDTVLSALSTVRENVLLFCNNCVQQGRRDLFLNKPAQPEERTDKIAEKIETVLSSVWNVEKTLLKTPAPAAAVAALEIVKTERDANPFALRVRGIPESKNKEKGLRFQEDLAIVKKILNILTGTDPVIDDAYRLGMWNNDFNRPPRTLLVILRSQIDKRVILSSLVKLKTSEFYKNVYVSRDLSTVEYRRECKLLKIRKDFISSGFPRNALRLKDNELLKKK